MRSSLPAIAMAAGESLVLIALLVSLAVVGIYLITTNDLSWHLSTSNNRVIAQVWLALILGFVLLCKAPARVKIEKAPKHKRTKRVP